jgi:uncharacterized membrane protein YkoI
LISGCGEKDVDATPGKTTSSTASTTATTVITQQTTNTSDTTALITQEQAVNIAYKDANVTAENAKKLRVELDRYDTVPHYEIEFDADGMEYDYDIHAKTGEILSKEKEPID